jgi:hypothetical protein
VTIGEVLIPGYNDYDERYRSLLSGMGIGYIFVLTSMEKEK